MLRNPVYYGDIRWKKQIYKGTHEGLISYSMWKKCADKLVKSGGPKMKRRYLLAGFLTYHNGRLFSGELQKQRVYYGARIEETGKGHRVYVREDEVFHKLDSQVAQICWSDRFADLVQELAREMISEEKAHVDKNKASFDAQLRHIEQKKNRFLDLYADGHLERAIYLQKVAELDRNEEYLLSKLERYQMDESVLFQKIEEISSKFLDLRRIYEDADSEVKIKILRSMCDRAVIEEDKTLDLKLKEPYVRFMQEPILASCRSDNPVRHHTLLRPLGESNPYCGNENPES